MFVKYSVDVSVVLCGVMCVCACVQPLIGGVARTHNTPAPAKARTGLLHIKVLFFRKRLWGHDNIGVCSYVQPCAHHLHITVCMAICRRDLVDNFLTFLV